MADQPRWVAPVAGALGAIALTGVYGYASFVLSGSADVTAYGSGIFDMDVRRVVIDLTTPLEGYRTSVHPLQKLFVAPLGIELNTALFDGANGLAAAKLLIAAVTVLQTLLVAWLVHRWTDRSPGAAIAAGAVHGLSFSSLLAASIPESAALSSIGSTLPLVLLTARMARPFSRIEGALWGCVGVVCIGLTITQLVHWVIALAVRAVTASRRRRSDSGLPGVAVPIAIGVATFVGLTWGAVQLQSAAFEGTLEFYSENPIAGELPFFRIASIELAPLSHTTRLAEHFVLYDFVAPFPGYSDFLIRDYGLDYWSLSIEDVSLEQWTAAQLVLGGALLAAVAIGCVSLRRADERWVAPLLCVASQFGLHFLYGREYILYSPNWHGVWVAILVGAIWKALEQHKRVLIAATAVLVTAMLANNLLVLESVYREVEAGLHVNVRDAHGALRR